MAYSQPQFRTEFSFTDGFMGVFVRGIRRKIRLLEAYGCYKDLDDIANYLGKKPGTILSWADGSGSQLPNEVPKKSFLIFLKLFENALPETSLARVKEIVFAPVSQLENELRARLGASFMYFVNTEADRNACRFFPIERQEIGLIETSLSRERESAGEIVGLGEHFRIRVERNLQNRHILALQCAHSSWGIVPHTTDLATGHVDLPGKDTDGELATMNEPRDTGIHHFIVMAVNNPIPEDIASSRDQKLTLDCAKLNELALFYQEQPKNQRKLFLMKIEVQKR
ncbi:MAG: hypothetical protein L3J30_12715 [Marinosulfonomonas sp.]|nr:hypothetical protein [Marinosulfonomonas sp.]